MAFTVVEYYGEQNKSRCGYCKQTDSSFSHGMHAYVMTAQDYQDLIDRGWRRSGLYCYKPNNNTTCCPAYTIKCDSQQFKLSKSHKKILRRMNKFLTDGIKDKNDDCVSQKSDDFLMVDREKVGDGSSSTGIKEEPDIPHVTIRNINIDEIKDGSIISNTGNSESSKEKTEVSSKSNVTDSPQSTSVLLSSQKEIKKGIGPSDSKPLCKKAKQIRLERKKQKLEAKGISMEDFMSDNKNQKNKNQGKNLSEYINSEPENGCHKLKTKLIDVNSDEFQSTLEHTYGLYEKYQKIIHNDPPGGIPDYLNFLQRSPLKNKKVSNGPSEGYGSFHQQYWLDDKLIAVGVIDILPYCVSSVYFFYDPDYSFLSLGTYGSLREIDFTRQLSEEVPSLKYYYMGFYIHSCPKMRYKGKLTPSYLLCPEVYSWHLLTDEMKMKLDENKYQRLNEDQNAKDEDEFTENDLDSVLLLINQTKFIKYEQYRRSFNINSVDQMLEFIRRRIYDELIGNNDEATTISEYGRLVGKKCAHRMLYVH